LGWRRRQWHKKLPNLKGYKKKAALSRGGCVATGQ